MVSLLCSDFAELETANGVDRILLKSDADFANVRRALFVCAECGDLGCGAITVLVKRTADRVVGDDFGYENTYEERLTSDDYADVGPFEFEFHQYESTFLTALAKLKSL
jgi:hypothetical protein